MGRWENLPSGAEPGGESSITTINPHDKYKRGKGLNYKEYSDFSGICSLCNDQIIQCYHWLDKDMIWEEFMLRCRECPYAKNQRRNRWVSDSITETNRYPYFIDRIAEVEWDKPKNYVYFISDGQYIKIGVAKNPDKRLSELQTGNPRKLKVICKIPVGSDREAFDLESRLHFEYQAFAKSGEWFNILDHILVDEFIKKFGDDEND